VIFQLTFTQAGRGNRASGLLSFMGLTAKTVKPALIWANPGDFCGAAWYNH
jgi:hypothetical protein